MFTGLVEEVGTVVEVATRPEGRRMTIRAPGIAPDLTDGASVAVDGACLTVAALEAATFAVDVVPATLARTIAGAYGTSTWRERCAWATVSAATWCRGTSTGWVPWSPGPTPPPGTAPVSSPSASHPKWPAPPSRAAPSPSTG